MKQFSLIWLLNGSFLVSFLFAQSSNAQIVPDQTLPENSIVAPKGDIIQINGGTTKGSNLFHSFEQFSVFEGKTAFFKNALNIQNILSRVTGKSISEINGIIKTNGTANLFFINPNGIIFGENASLDVGGSFIATTADSILFPNGIEYSASDTQTPLLTINAPIGLRFRDNPAPITNFSLLTDDAGEDLIGLRVPINQTLALIGGDVSIEGGFLSTIGGRIEIGSVADNNIVSLTPVEKGWDVGYQGVNNFQDISFSGAAYVESRGENTGDIEVQGRNITLIEGSEIAINTSQGKAGNLTVIASDSLNLSGNAAEVDLGDFETSIFNNVSDEATGEGSKLTIDTDRLTLKNGAQITAITRSIGKGVDINIKASEIEIDKPFDDLEVFKDAGIFALVDGAEGNGGNITIDTQKLTVKNGAQISTDTFGAGNAGNLFINAFQFIELIGTVPEDTQPSALFANVGENINATGNGGDLSITTPKLIVRDGAQIGTTAQNTGNGGNLTINASEFVLLSGFSPLAEYRGKGLSGIFVSAEPFFTDEESGTIIPTTGNGGTLNLTTPNLIVEKGASISADTFSLGKGGNANLNVNKLIISNGSEIRAGSLLEIDAIDEQRGTGGTLNINANDSIEVTGTGDINGTPVKSSILTKAEGTGNAGDLTITTNKLTVADGGEINASAIGTGSAGDLKITANNVNLNQGTITATTAAGTGGNIELDIAKNLIMRDNSQISAQATGEADGGNVTINSDFIVAFPNQNNDILASAEAGNGGNINITANGVLGLVERTQNPFTNDIDASSQFSLDGNVIINTPDTDILQQVAETPENLVDPDEVIAGVCNSADTASGILEEKQNTLVINGKGGVPPEPTEPFNSDVLVINGQAITVGTEEVTSRDTATVATKAEVDIDSIIPAQGIVRTDDGQVLLVGYVTADSTTRYSQHSRNCSI